MCKPRMVHVRTYHPPIHFLAPTTIPVLSPVLFIPSLYYTSYNSKNFFIYLHSHHIKLYIYTYIHVHVCMYVHNNTHTHSHTLTHTYILPFSVCSSCSFSCSADSYTHKTHSLTIWFQYGRTGEWNYLVSGCQFF